MAHKPKTILSVLSPKSPVARSESNGSGTIVAPPHDLTHEAIAQRAYEIYAARGFAPGQPQEDWLEAERQLKAGFHSRSIAAKSDNW